jgi:hypothetical protein
MDNTNVKPGTRLLNNVGSFAIIDNATNMVAFTGIFSTTYAIAISMAAQDTRAGAGNALIFRSYSDRNVQVTLTVQDWNLEYVAASVGSKILVGLTELFIIEEPINIGENGIGILDTPAVGNISARLSNGSRVNITASDDNEIDVSAFGIENDCVWVTYAFTATAKTVTITADQAPYIGKLVMQGVISDSLVGKVGNVTVEIPAFALDGNINITMNSDGTTSTTEMVGVALAVSGAQCKDGMVYGYVKEYVEMDAAQMSVSEITASPSPIELALLPAPETQMITVVGSRGVMYSEIGILNSDCTFESSDATVATVDNTGLITAVDAGECVITVDYNGLTDDIDVEVV